jgi:hypothetical protein
MTRITTLLVLGGALLAVPTRPLEAQARLQADSVRSQQQANESARTRTASLVTPLRASTRAPARAGGPGDAAVRDSLSALGARLRTTPKQKGVDRGAVVAAQAAARRTGTASGAASPAAAGTSGPTAERIGATTTPPLPPVKPAAKGAAARTGTPRG